ncbi:hypothetical protein GCM10027159_12620 [Lysobacter terrae]
MLSLHLIDDGYELAQIIRRIATGAIPQGDPGAAFDFGEAPLHRAAQAHALQRAEAAGHAQCVLGIDEGHGHVQRLPFAIDFAEAAAGARLDRQLAGIAPPGVVLGPPAADVVDQGVPGGLGIDRDRLRIFEGEPVRRGLFDLRARIGRGQRREDEDCRHEAAHADSPEVKWPD